MSLCNAYRSFAIYIVIVSIISESPISSFTIRRTRTTTLRPLDLTGEESALLEVKSKLSKLNNVRDNFKYGREKYTTRKSVNFLTPDKKLVSDEQSVGTTTFDPLNNNNELIKPSNKTPIRDSGATTGVDGTENIQPEKYHILNTVKNTQSFVSESNTFDLVTNDYKASNIDISGTNRQHNNSHVTTKEEGEIIDKQNEDRKIGTTTIITEDIKSTGGEITTSKIPVDISTTIVNDNDKETTANTNEESNHYEISSGEMTTSEPDTTYKTETSGATRTETIVTDATKHTESIEGQSSNESTKNPFWKKYTVIERKRIVPTTDPDIKSTEELKIGESVSSTINQENIVSASTTQLKETTTNDDDNSITVTTQVTNIITEPKIKRLSSTELIYTNLESNTTTIASVESKRAGYLDFSSKQVTVKENEVTTEPWLNIYNETELLGTIFEVETQEDGPETKNNTRTEPQKMLDEDAIKEELLKEQVLSDHDENSKRLLEQQELDNVKPLDSNEGTEDSLSVKPITHGKGALYTVNSNYRKMKKIEVQPSKPFVRDPDDNSWRNESLNSLGIVFKAKNASKPFTQVLKNKTEAELNNLTQPERENNNNEVPDLRQRLEKITEVRKSRKKKIDKFGETIYTDYEETSGEVLGTPKTDTVSIPVMEVEGEMFFVPSTVFSPVTRVTHRTTTPSVYMSKDETVTTTKKPKKVNTFHEYYDTTDESDADYLSLVKIDLKKFSKPPFTTDDNATTTATTPNTPVLMPFTKLAPASERQPTVQYFPPRQKPKPKVSVNDYDGEFLKKVNIYSQEKLSKYEPPITHGTPRPATMLNEKEIEYNKQNVAPQFPSYKTANLDRNVYVTFPSHLVEHGNKYPRINDESFNRASYVIKHYRDLINEAVKDDYDKSGEFVSLPFTDTPLMGVTMTKDKGPLKQMDEDYEYDGNFRKDIMNRFVDNFNKNSERFKADFPILYNSTVVHMKAQENGKVVASSTAFMKRLYGEGSALQAGAEGGPAGRPCDPHCEMAVELSPAYELHYYVPEQEEKEEAEHKMRTIPFPYKL